MVLRPGRQVLMLLLLFGSRRVVGLVPAQIHRECMNGWRDLRIWLAEMPTHVRVFISGNFKTLKRSFRE